MPIEYFEARERALLGPRFAELYAPPEAEAARGVTVSALRMTPEVFAAGADFAVEPSPFCRAGFLVRQPDFRPGRHPWHHAGVFYSQEPSASSAAPLLGVQPGMRVLDLCAAPGGKTSQLAAALEGRGLLVANEYVPARAEVLKSNLERMGVANAVVLNESPQRIAEALPAFFDRILVDAPCSGRECSAKSRRPSGSTRRPWWPSARLWGPPSWTAPRRPWPPAARSSIPPAPSPPRRTRARWRRFWPGTPTLPWPM